MSTIFLVCRSLIRMSGSNMTKTPSLFADPSNEGYNCNKTWLPRDHLLSHRVVLTSVNASVEWDKICIYVQIQYSKAITNHAPYRGLELDGSLAKIVFFFDQVPFWWLVWATEWPRLFQPGEQWTAMGRQLAGNNKSLRDKNSARNHPDGCHNSHNSL